MFRKRPGNETVEAFELGNAVRYYCHDQQRARNFAVKVEPGPDLSQKKNHRLLGKE